MRLTILGGYLGAGKTTWLRHQLFSGALSDAVVLVNEAARTPVDDALLKSVSCVLSGGCACCDGRADMIAALRDLADQKSQGRALAHVVLETSGLADPGAIIAAVQDDPVLVHHVRFDPIRVVVDALHGLAQLRDEPLARRQVASADILTLTKCDSASPVELARLVATLRSLNPDADLGFSELGRDVAPPDLPDARPEVLPHLAEEGPPPVPMRLTVPPGTDWSALSVWLSALLHARGDDLVRVKGVVRTPAGRLLLQTVRRIVQRPEILPEDSAAQDNVLIFIGRGFTHDELERSFARFVLGED
ncbi:MAG: GTP-binding protein [Pseudodonghicola sp.]|nr:GTP-binding protein [Pseudodonghicola sp.]